eukprot:CAMPEP_0114138434 /NCGR_PEP_ID=MMETSP0043_2-20121206/16317_1 /TAXON_ID=464988 /ORGANISM="Hemiselmis andersenii, Strain CCMP644" /LENGTH=60 /DNA_ID=CAMNT_0001232397 /DNA_START=297 /DNA_END=475 /DNA_ORIENTATION=-
MHTTHQAPERPARNIKDHPQAPRPDTVDETRIHQPAAVPALREPSARGTGVREGPPAPPP